MCEASIPFHLSQVWLFWLVLGGSAVDKALEKYAPTLRHYAWFFFKVRGRPSAAVHGIAY